MSITALRSIFSWAEEKVEAIDASKDGRLEDVYITSKKLEVRRSVTVSLLVRKRCTDVTNVHTERTIGFRLFAHLTISYYSKLTVVSLSSFLSIRCAIRYFLLQY